MEGEEDERVKEGQDYNKIKREKFFHLPSLLVQV